MAAFITFTMKNDTIMKLHAQTKCARDPFCSISIMHFALSIDGNCCTFHASFASDETIQVRFCTETFWSETQGEKR